MVLSSTDLPAPEPPTTPTTSPLGMVRSRPSWTMLSPKRETRPFTSIGGAVLVDRVLRLDDGVHTFSFM